jgi:hypothetical protein
MPLLDHFRPPLSSERRWDAFHGASPAYSLPAYVSTYAVAYRGVQRAGEDQIEIWREHLRLGEALPVLPLAIHADFVLRVDFEATYADLCRRRKLA